MGRRGSSKSTLLRYIAGLTALTPGTVRYRGKKLNGANPAVCIVFQSFALRPWLTVDLPQPRDRCSPEFEALVDTVYGILTGRWAEADLSSRETARAKSTQSEAAYELGNSLLSAHIGEIAGLIELLSAHGGHEGLAEIADELRYELDDLLPVVDAVDLAKLARSENGTLRADGVLTDLRHTYGEQEARTQ